MSLQPWQLYDFDAVGREFLRIVRLAINPTPGPSDLQVIGWRDPNSTTTPRVEVIFQPGISNDSRVSPNIFNPSAAYENLMEFQPINAWPYSLVIRVVTERMQNSSVHSELTAKARCAVLFPWCAQKWTQEVFTIRDPREQPQTPEVDNEENEDVTNLNFTGLFMIRNSAWGQLA